MKRIAPKPIDPLPTPEFVVVDGSILDSTPMYISKRSSAPITEPDLGVVPKPLATPIMETSTEIIEISFTMDDEMPVKKDKVKKEPSSKVKDKKKAEKKEKEKKKKAKAKKQKAKEKEKAKKKKDKAKKKAKNKKKK